MKKQFSKNFLTGVVSVLCIATFPEYVLPKKGDFLNDRKQLRKDALNFSKDLCSVTNKGYRKISLNKD